MRNGYPISSIEFNDKLTLSYENLVYLLGLDTDTLSVTGLYDQLDSSGLAYMTNLSGIPHIGTYVGIYGIGLNSDASSDVIIDYQRADYLLKRYLGVINE